MLRNFKATCTIGFKNIRNERIGIIKVSSMLEVAKTRKKKLKIGLK